MARQKSAKVQKTSYTERVLGAMTQIQKEHRKHAIHMATLRAQVRKNADAKKDALGPHWTKWVNKAIDKLVDEGVIEHPNTQEVAFTQTGKQLIATAKKTVPDEDHLIHHLSTNLSRGRKRRRSSTGLGQDGNSASAKRTRSVSTFGGNIHMTPTRQRLPQVPTGSASVTPTRPRQSQGQAVVAFRDMSPLTDISEDSDDEDHRGDDTTAILTAELREKEKVIAALRDEVAALKKAQSQLTPSNRGSRHSTPQTTHDTSQATSPTLSTPRRPIATTSAAETTAETTRGRVPKGITRTQSGSYISDVSKQPTPAPSDREASVDDDLGTPGPPADDYPHRTPDVDDDLDILGVSPDEYTRPSALSQWPTPDSSTSRRDSDAAANHATFSMEPGIDGSTTLSQRTSTPNTEIPTATATRDSHVGSEERAQARGDSREQRSPDLAGRVEDLERRLGEKDARIKDLIAQKEGLEARNLSLQKELADVQAQLAVEVTDRAQAITEIQTKLGEIAVLRQSMEALAEGQDSAQAEMNEEREKAESRRAEAARDLEAALANHDTARAKIEDLTAQLDHSNATAAQAAATLAAVREESEVRLNRIHELEALVESLQRARDQAREDAEGLQQLLKDREQELGRAKTVSEVLTTSLSKTDAKLASVEANLREAQQTVDEQAAEISRITEKLSETEDTNVQLRSRLNASEVELRDIKRALVDAESRVESLEEEARTKEAEKQGLAAKLADAERQLAAAEERRVALETRAEEAQQELNRKISGLEEKVALDQTEIGRLASKLRDLGMQLEEAKSTLDKVRAEEQRTRVELESEKSRADLLEEEKLKGMERVQSLEREVTKVNAQLSESVTDFETLKSCVDGFRESQLVSLDSFGEEVASIKLRRSLAVDANTGTQNLVVEQQRVQI
ncbi:hypothetical protein D9611_007260 [Ephemerocybe angulata]|uniref:Uncharacterized protein n=1 Tax=Ephemerocybe angulata TaxID=980116 RepID=A0A8H5EW63_9AGAR|nr:hypothetical protein D9611_007260 [Tulosesus angulatus]